MRPNLEPSKCSEALDRPQTRKQALSWGSSWARGMPPCPLSPGNPWTWQCPGKGLPPVPYVFRTCSLTLVPIALIGQGPAFPVSGLRPKDGTLHLAKPPSQGHTEVSCTPLRPQLYSHALPLSPQPSTSAATWTTLRAGLFEVCPFSTTKR